MLPWPVKSLETICQLSDPEFRLTSATTLFEYVVPRLPKYSELAKQASGARHLLDLCQDEFEPKLYNDLCFAVDQRNRILHALGTRPILAIRASSYLEAAIIQLCADLPPAEAAEILGSSESAPVEISEPQPDASVAPTASAHWESPIDVNPPQPRGRSFGLEPRDSRSIVECGSKAASSSNVEPTRPSSGRFTFSSIPIRAYGENRGWRQLVAVLCFALGVLLAWGTPAGNWLFASFRIGMQPALLVLCPMIALILWASVNMPNPWEGDTTWLEGIGKVVVVIVVGTALLFACLVLYVIVAAFWSLLLWLTVQFGLNVVRVRDWFLWKTFAASFFGATTYWLFLPWIVTLVRLCMACLPERVDSQEASAYECAILSVEPENQPSERRRDPIVLNQLTIGSIGVSVALIVLIVFLGTSAASVTLSWATRHFWMTLILLGGVGIPTATFVSEQDIPIKDLIAAYTFWECLLLYPFLQIIRILVIHTTIELIAYSLWYVLVATVIARSCLLGIALTGLVFDIDVRIEYPGRSPKH